MKIIGRNTKSRTSTESIVGPVADLLEARHLAAAICASHGCIQGLPFKSNTPLPILRLICSMYSFVPVANAVAQAGSLSGPCAAFTSSCPAAGVAPRSSQTVGTVARTDRGVVEDVDGLAGPAKLDADDRGVVAVLFDFLDLCEAAALLLKNLPFLITVSLTIGGLIDGRIDLPVMQGLVRQNGIVHKHQQQLESRRKTNVLGEAT